MKKLERLEKEIELTKQLIKLKKELKQLEQSIVFTPYVPYVPYSPQPNTIPYTPPVNPWSTTPYIGDVPFYGNRTITCGNNQTIKSSNSMDTTSMFIHA